MGAPSIHKMVWVVVGDGQACPQGRGGAGAGGEDGWWRHGGKPENTPAVGEGCCLARGELESCLQTTDTTTVRTEIKRN